MITKLFEVRDRATFLPVIATDMRSGADEKEAFLLQRSGFSDEIPLVLISRLEGGTSRWDPEDWGDRTMHEAHRFIERHWDHLDSGAVIDIQFILDETNAPKKSERR